jgi:hypothetical protein
MASSFLVRAAIHRTVAFRMVRARIHTKYEREAFASPFWVRMTGLDLIIVATSF